MKNTQIRKNLANFFTRPKEIENHFALQTFFMRCYSFNISFVKLFIKIPLHLIKYYVFLSHIKSS